ncbi:hypothetical protein ACNPQM_44015 [Streptomyces sp. NPDC056231]|uniref:hypothetical protein n=1 Tax=Streptomyces sp. NPDC056231 TaxID=3345755 RepID=UPI003AAC3EF8
MFASPALTPDGQVLRNAKSGVTSALTTPVLKSFSLSGSHTTPGSSFAVNYSAEEDSGSLSRVVFSFVDPIGGSRVFAAYSNPPLSGRVEQDIPSNWPNGKYTLDYVNLIDAAGNGISYFTDFVSK